MEKQTTGHVENINTKNYWENRFSTGDWEEKGGRNQTASFAATQVRHFRIPQNFEGLMVDFGCGLGDAMPIYRQFFPSAKLVGIDVSEAAVDKCRARYGHIAQFIHGNHHVCPEADIIIASNVFEHLSEDVSIAKDLLGKCRALYIVVPYKEKPLCTEHVRSYDEKYFRSLGKFEYTIFPSRGWTEYGWGLIKLNLKNMARRILGCDVSPRRMQIMFHFRGDQHRENI